MKFASNTKITFYKNVFDNGVCNMEAISSSPNMSSDQRLIPDFISDNDLYLSIIQCNSGLKLIT